MPFRSVDTFPENPAVRIFFSGLMIIKPDENGESCEVFVHRGALDHEFSVEVREKRPGKPDAILMRYFGPLAFVSPPTDDPPHGLRITAESPKGLAKYTGGPLPTGEDSLELAINLKKGTFNHEKPIEVDLLRGRPSILLDDGVFYTAEKTPEDLLVRLAKGGVSLGDVNPFANLLAAVISLEGDEALNIRWRERGLPKVLPLRRKSDVSSYEIYILNEPLFVPDDAAVHDEFKEYYDMLTFVPGPDRSSISLPDDDRFKLEIVIPENEAESRGTPRTLCMPLVMDSE